MILNCLINEINKLRIQAILDCVMHISTNTMTVINNAGSILSVWRKPEKRTASTARAPPSDDFETNLRNTALLVAQLHKLKRLYLSQIMSD